MLTNAYTCGALAATFFAMSANAHMVMNTPTPYGFKDLQTSPLNGEGYNFPCQSGSRTDWDDADGASNPMKVGEDQPLKFTGSAVHGGGSCQLSLTYDFPPPADPSKWKVIHTYLGGCPSYAAGNIADSGTDSYGRPTGPQCAVGQHGECTNQYMFQLPSEVKNGNATLAWTWFNKIGNRELYMNCAPVSISGGKDDDSGMTDLPSMFVANIPGYCTTQEGNLNIPNPGKYVTMGEPVDDAASGTCAKGGSTSSYGSGSGSGSGSDTGSSSSAAAAPATSSAAPSSAQVTVTTLATTYAPAAATSAGSSPSIGHQHGSNPVGSSPDSSSGGSGGSDSSPSSSPSSSSSGSGSSSSSSSGDAGSSVSCTTPGSIICVSSDTWGMCDVNMKAVVQAVADGTTCANGVISRKRDLGSHAHRARHLHGSQVRASRNRRVRRVSDLEVEQVA